jgi:hypothetical protein
LHGVLLLGRLHFLLLPFPPHPFSSPPGGEGKG